tara:strand:+ start:4105 stop:4773 length:669 start_codon:yes stop_codon:yes gene_type:complete
MMNAAMTGTANANTTQKFGPPSPFIMFQPFNMVSFFGTFSPIILIILILSYSLFYQNVKGLVYLGFLLGSTLVRSVILQAMGSEKNKDNCGPVRYTDYGNPTFTTFVFAFTLLYLMIPMFQTGVINWFLLVFLIFYIVFDVCVKVMQGCLVISKQLSSIIGDFAGGALLSGAIVMAMYSGGSRHYLFFADQTANGNVCSRPSKQSFKCAVYKNGELVTSTTY